MKLATSFAILGAPLSHFDQPPAQPSFFGSFSAWKKNDTHEE